MQVGPANTVFIGDTITDMQAAVAAGISRRALVSTGYGATVRAALDAEGVDLPVTLVPSAGQTAGVPPDVLPVTVHRDLEATVRLLLKYGQLNVPPTTNGNGVRSC
jgi:hypothetical protein